MADDKSRWCSSTVRRPWRRIVEVSCIGSFTCYLSPRRHPHVSCLSGVAAAQGGLCSWTDACSVLVMDVARRRTGKSSGQVGKPGSRALFKESWSGSEEDGVTRTCTLTCSRMPSFAASRSHPPSTIHHPPFTIQHSPFTIHHSPFTIHHSPFTIHHSPFTIHRTEP
ncbi:hypothetical protein QBC36DRAFT_44734 [Triangularia setosa]|uniref:Uncharacterized protein n=1 Tax=Triangularia setosa TaxID=2587417 RepID=A0AAN6W3G9_9PEZI|nr:hypothetical protein QBC36DRAFT_44734 [Podospora setosa]